MTNPQTVTTADLQMLTGITPRRVHLWTHARILRPQMLYKRGHGERHFNQADALRVQLMMYLLTRRGIAPRPQARLVAKLSDEILASPWWSQKPTDQPQADDLLILLYAPEKWAQQRHRGLVVRRDQAIAEIAKHAGPGFIIDVAEVADPVRTCQKFRPRCVSK